MRAQKYPDGDCRRRFGGSRPVMRSTSKGRGSGSIGSSVLRATAWKDLDGGRVVQNARKEHVAVSADGLALGASAALMVMARFLRGGRRGR